jgi:hypothetical protein
MAQKWTCDICRSEIGEEGIAVFTKISKRKVYSPSNVDPNTRMTDKIEESKIDICLDCAEKIQQTIDKLKK